MKIDSLISKLLMTVLMLIFASASGLQAGPVTEVFTVTPAFSPFNVAGRSVTIRGVGFTPATTVSFDALAGAVTFIDSRTLVATIPVVVAEQISTVSVADPGNGNDSFFPFMYTGPVIHVAPGGNDTASGVDPLNPKGTLGSAFGAASGTTPTEVRVAAGTYPEAQLAIPSATVLSCGWAPGFGLRDEDAHVTVIDAGNGGWVIRTSGLENVSIIDGCTMTGGLRDGFGGGAIVISSDSTVVNNSVIVGNTSTSMGGAVYFTASTSYGGTPTLSNNMMLGNRAHNKNGGAIVVYPNYNTQQPVRVSIADNYLLGNRSVNGRGGAISLTTSTYSGYNTGILKIGDNVVMGNSARSGGGIDIGLLTSGDFFDITFDNNLVVGNTAQGSGGGVAYQGFGAVTGHLSSSTIANNAAAPGFGGGLFLSGALNLVPAFTASDLILWGNVADDAAGQALSRVDFSDSGTPLGGIGNISLDPSFISGLQGEFYLDQLGGPVSPAVDAGSAPVADLSVESLTTRPDDVSDTGVADQGYHYSQAVGASVAPIAVTRIDPGRGDLAGRDWVLIRGDGFDPGATVEFDGIPATNVLFVNNRRVLAQPEPHALGTVNVEVVNPDMTSSLVAAAYEYADTESPVWNTTVGLVSTVTDVDTCQRSVVLDWNSAADSVSNPVVYEVYREVCIVSASVLVPCDNFGFIPNATNFIGSTSETTYVDLAFTAGGQDKEWVYNVRARDSAFNKEWNFAKRVIPGGKGATEFPPEEIGDTLLYVPGSAVDLDWLTASGATQYGVYREGLASAYGTPLSLTPFIILDAINNDLNGDGIVDSFFTDAVIPAPGALFHYKITAMDPCGTETTTEL